MSKPVCCICKRLLFTDWELEHGYCAKCDMRADNDPDWFNRKRSAYLATLDPEVETPTEPVAVVAWWRDTPDVCPACLGSGCTGNIPMCMTCGKMAGEK